MTNPWSTRDNPWYFKKKKKKKTVFLGKNLVFSNPWRTRDQPMIYPVTTRDFFTGSNLPPCIRKYREICFFSWKKWDPRRSIRAVCMFGWQSEFHCYSGMAVEHFSERDCKISMGGLGRSFCSYILDSHQICYKEIIEASSGATKWPEPPSLQKTETWFQKSPPMIPFQSITCFESDCVVSPCLLCFPLHSFCTDLFVVWPNCIFFSCVFFYFLFLVIFFSCFCLICFYSLILFFFVCLNLFILFLFSLCRSLDVLSRAKTQNK